jgi:DNA-binding MarR family transcriptional regulator
MLSGRTFKHRIHLSQEGDNELPKNAQFLSSLNNAGPELVHTLDVEPASDGMNYMSIARSILRCRDKRRHFLPPSMFNEPAWDILLELYTSDLDASQQTIRRLARRFDLPLSTALRWIAYLQKNDMIVRRANPNNKRMTMIYMSPRGRELLEAYLESVRPSHEALSTLK